MTTIRPNKRRFAIGFYILSGRMPWGRDLSVLGSATRHRPNYWPICCGHVLRDAEVEAWITAGLLVETIAVRGLRTVIAGPQLEAWISRAWHQLQVRSWGR